MLFDTSKARMTVPSRTGRATFIVGRASAKASSPSAAAKSANGMWRRDAAPLRGRRRHEPFGGEPGRAVGAQPERPPVREDERRDDDEDEQQPRRAERHQRRRRFRDSTMRTSAGTRSSSVETS